MKHTEEVVEYALDCYLQFDEKNERKYTLQQIANLIQQKFNKPIDKSTISLWARNNNWDLLFQDVVNRGIEKAIQESQEKEETLKNAKARETSEIYKQNKAKNDMSGYLIIKTLEYYAKKVKSGEMSVDELPLQIRDLEYLNKSSFENLDRMNRGGDDDKWDQLFGMFNSI